jgi:hypothetical protein
MSQHLHCPHCDHCISHHVIMPVEREASTDNELLCEDCLRDEAGIPVCPAEASTELRPETLRLMFISNLRHTIENVGL